jgi:hypothetical protein
MMELTDQTRKGMTPMKNMLALAALLLSAVGPLA